MGVGKASIVAILALFILASNASADMPASFYQAMSSMKNEEVLCVKNYEAGASVTEAYRDFESLDKETEVVSRTYPDWPGNASLEVSINSYVFGNAHIAWQSRDSLPDQKGRHDLYSRSVEDLSGAFSIQKFIQLWSNSSIYGNVSLDWLPCA
ncbi:MAG: hypothetical protein HPY61_01100 [Methanotrichaceae archaeon]|nr:hypothetical protein [Methanotrichaceae archaeon]